MRAVLMLLVALPLGAQPGDPQPPAPPPPPPAVAKPSIDKCEKSMADAKKVYEIACARARAQAIRELEYILKTELSRGNLDNAVLIRAKIEEYQKEQPKIEVKKPEIVGRWTWIHGRTATFNADGTAEKYSGSAKVSNGKWKMDKNKVEVEWKETDGIIYLDSIEPGENTAKVLNMDNGRMVYEIRRLPDKE